LEGIEQILLPPMELGWADRFKTEHFMHYSDVSHAFAKLIGIDPWLINPTSIACGPINFKERTGLEELASTVNQVLDDTKQYYETHDISCTPFVIVKSDSGTYGMAIMSVNSPEDILSLNRKQRNKMSSVKEGLLVEQMLVQEGVYTYEQVEGAVAEPVVYMIGSHVVGGFYRVHTGKTATDNLNSPGMHFEPLSFEESCVMPDETQTPDASPTVFTPMAWWHAWRYWRRHVKLPMPKGFAQLGSNLNTPPSLAPLTEKGIERSCFMPKLMLIRRTQ